MTEPALTQDYQSLDPSYYRRKELLDVIDRDGVSCCSSFPIVEYFAIADKVGLAFEEAIEENELDVAFAYGTRFSRFCLDSLPKHNEYLSDLYQTKRLKYIRDAKRVLDYVEQEITEGMNREERSKHEKRLKEALPDAARVEAKRKSQEEAIIQPPKRAKHPKVSKTADEEEPSVNPSIAVGLPLPPTVLSPSYGDIGAQTTSRSKSSGPLPAALSPPITGTQVVTPVNPLMAPATGAPTTSPNHPDPLTNSPPTQQKQPPKKIPVRQLGDEALGRFQELRTSRKIQEQLLDTYQGRHKASLNGCVVISALMVARHLDTPAPALLMQDIKEVIDTKCVPHLQAVRQMGNLGRSAYVDPYDVHERLDERGISRGVATQLEGNVLSEEDMGKYLQLFQREGKLGGTFFFRQHSISILKIANRDGTTFYDVIDSLARTDCATLTRCKDDEALNILLKWYTTKKLTELEEYCTHIDHNEWSHLGSDIRTFQGCVWRK